MAALTECSCLSCHFLANSSSTESCVFCLFVCVFVICATLRSSLHRRAVVSQADGSHFDLAQICHFFLPVCNLKNLHFYQILLSADCYESVHYWLIQWILHLMQHNARLQNTQKSMRCVCAVKVLTINALACTAGGDQCFGSTLRIIPAQSLQVIWLFCLGWPFFETLPHQVCSATSAPHFWFLPKQQSACLCLQNSQFGASGKSMFVEHVYNSFEFPRGCFFPFHNFGFSVFPNRRVEREVCAVGVL